MFNVNNYVNVKNLNERYKQVLSVFYKPNSLLFPCYTEKQISDLLHCMACSFVTMNTHTVLLQIILTIVINA